LSRPSLGATRFLFGHLTFRDFVDHWLLAFRRSIALA
jgi:hypothetical protein